MIYTSKSIYIINTDDNEYKTYYIHRVGDARAATNNIIQLVVLIQLCLFTKFYPFPYNQSKAVIFQFLLDPIGVPTRTLP